MTSKKRRVLLQSALASAAAVIGLQGLNAKAREPEQGSSGGAPSAIDIHIELRAVEDDVAILPGKKTRVWRYRGTLLRGPADALQPSPGRYAGSVIRVRRGQRIRIDLINDLPESTIIHWHGLHVPEAMDGHPRFAIEPGARYVYEFTVVNRAGSYWFHPHPHGRTGKQVYFGMAGMIVVSDDEEGALDVPRGAYDIPLIVQDRIFDDDNQLVYLSGSTPGGRPEHAASRGMMGRGMGGMMGGMGGMMGGDNNAGGPMRGMGQMMAGMMGVLGDRILVNGQPDASLSFEARPYRLRLLNASNSRMLKLAWNDGSPLTVIGTDGGLLGRPLQRSYVMLAPAERADLWVDFSRWPAGTELTLQSLAFDSGMSMSGMMGASALPDGAPFPVLKARIAQGAAAPASQPPRLAALPRIEPALAVNVNSPKVFNLTMGMMVWGINGNSFDMQGVTALETVRLGTHEIWEFRNDARMGMMMAMAHSMHVHGLQFRVLGRSVGDSGAAAYDTVKAGFLDEGWKDTVLVMPGERIRILLRFADYLGLFLYHCHMLEHEDSGLMRNYLVKA